MKAMLAPHRYPWRPPRRPSLLRCAWIMNLEIIFLSYESHASHALHALLGFGAVLLMLLYDLYAFLRESFLRQEQNEPVRDGVGGQDNQADGPLPTETMKASSCCVLGVFGVLGLGCLGLRVATYICKLRLGVLKDQGVDDGMYSRYWF